MPNYLVSNINLNNYKTMDYKQRPSNPIKLLEDYMKRKRYTEKTILQYLNCIKYVISNSGKDCYHLTANDLYKNIYIKYRL